MNKTDAPLSKPLVDTLEAVRRLIAREGYSPSIRDLVEDLGVTANAVHERLTKLRDRGLIVWTNGKGRSIRLAGDKPAGLRFWIDARYCRPNKGGKYFVTVLQPGQLEPLVSTAWFDGQRWSMLPASWVKPGMITHWAAIPPVPEAEQ